jgi:RNA polymerase sigma-70 factor (ECF subfamily)
MAVSVPEPTDETLAARAASGDGHAFEELVTRYQARMFRLACRMTSEADAPDILQDTFLQVHRHLAEFRGASKFGTWLYRIATNTCLMHRRSASRRPADSLEMYMPRFDGSGGHAGTPDELRVVSRIDDLIDQATLAAKAREAIGRLPDLYRDAFVLRDLEGLATTEVAEALGIDSATVRQRAHRARLMLRGFLSDLAGVTS